MPAGSRIPKGHPANSFFARRDPKAEIYVTHIDVTSASKRKRHFLMQLGMNMLWSILLARRIYRGLSRYGVWFAVGKLAPRWSATAPAFDMSLLGNITLDLIIFIVLVPVVSEFVCGAAILRFRHGFPQEEIIFRKPSESTVANVVVEASEKRDAMLKDLLHRAVDPEEMKRALFGLPWEEWAYDYNAMTEAHELNKNGVIDAKTWELCIWMKASGEWTVVEERKEVDIQNQKGMMDKMKIHLQAMGKLHVFRQVMEVIQVKTMTNDGKPLPVTEEVDAIIADIFRRNDVDFAKLTNELAQNASSSTRFSDRSKKRD